jgi:Ca2+-binding EF-hand superfamily protein
MSSISSVSSSILSSLFSVKNTRTGSSSSAVENLFSQLDTTGKGYLEKSDLSTASSQISSSSTSSTSSASVDDVFARLDSDSDGKVTEDELSSGLDALASELDAQFNQMRMSGAMPPPPPPSDSDTGFTQDELESQLSEIGSSDSKRSDLLNKIVANFDTADTNSDGKVSFAEAQAYDQSASSTSSSTSTTASAATDAGFTVDELTQQLSDIGTSDSARSDLINRIVNNFAAADTDGDGKVSNSEAMAYDQSSTSTTASATDSTTSSDLAIMKRIMELMNAYALTSSTDSNNSVASTLSVSA